MNADFSSSMSSCSSALIVFQSWRSVVGARSRRTCFARQRRSPLTRTNRSPLGVGRSRIGLSGWRVPRLAILATSSSILSGSIHCRGWSGFGSILSSSTSTRTPPLATGGSGALPMAARRAARSLIVSEPPLIFSLRDTCDDLLGDKLVFHGLTPFRRIEQNRHALPGRASNAIALVDSRPEHQRTEDPHDLLTDAASHDPRLLLERAECAEQTESRIRGAPQRLDGRVRPQRTGYARGLEPHGDEHIRARHHRVDGEHPKRRRTVGKNEVVFVSDAV